MSKSAKMCRRSKTYIEEESKMGKKCIERDCPYLAEDWTCLLPEIDTSEKCQAREHVGYEEIEDWISGRYVRERLKSLGILE